MKKLLSVMLALAILTSTVSLAHASDSEALNGKSGRWADFDESLYNTVVFVSTALSGPKAAACCSRCRAPPIP